VAVGGAKDGGVQGPGGCGGVAEITAAAG
jgi:hypothetical protein